MEISCLGGFLLLSALSFEDIREKKIAVYKVFLFSAAAVLYRTLCEKADWTELAVSVIPGLLLLLLSLLFRESIGEGDGMTVLALGLWTGGWFALEVVCIGSLLSAIYGAASLIRGKRETFAFIPFLLVGMEVLLFVS